MAISMAGLASANAGGLQAERQRVVDAEAARKNQADQLQFEQLQRQEALRSRVDPVINGEAGLGDTTPAPQTNGSRLKDSVMGLFGASPSTSASDPSAPSIPQPAASMGASTPALARPVPQPDQPVSTSKLMQQRVDAYAAKNPNDIAGINAMQAKAYDAAQNEVTKKQNVFMAQGNEAIRKLVAFNDVSGVQDLMSNHWPDGKQYQFQANKDGSYDVAQVGNSQTKHFNNMDELGSAITSVLNPTQYQAAHAKAQEAGLTEGAKLPAQQALETTKAEAKAKGDTDTALATGVKDKNLGNAARGYGIANKDNAEAELTRSGGKGGLTLPQQRSNAEIDAARNTIAGLSSEDIAHRTARATNTGRENKDFDPGLAKQVTLAARRKVGSDDLFDQQKTEGSQVVLAGKPMDKWADEQLQKVYGSASPAGKAKIDTEVMRRQFKNDPAMSGNTMGELTPKGYAVLDNTGNLIGHYAK